MEGGNVAMEAVTSGITSLTGYMGEVLDLVTTNQFLGLLAGVCIVGAVIGLVGRMKHTAIG